MFAHTAGAQAPPAAALLTAEHPLQRLVTLSEDTLRKHAFVGGEASENAPSALSLLALVFTTSDASAETDSDGDSDDDADSEADAEAEADFATESALLTLTATAAAVTALTNAKPNHNSNSTSSSSSSSNSNSGSSSSGSSTSSGNSNNKASLPPVRLTAVEQLLCGAAAGAVGKTVVAPFDRVKLLYMVNPARTFTFTAATKTFRTIFVNTGVSGLFKGNGSAMWRVLPYSALTFTTFDRYHRYLRANLPDEANHPVVARFLAGAAAGTTATVLTYPLDVLRARAAAHWGANALYSSAGKGIADIVQKEGVRALFAGIMPTLYGIVPYGGISFAVFETLKAAYVTAVLPAGSKDSDVPAAVRFIAGGLAGVAATTVVQPLQIVRRRMQVSTVVDGMPQYRSTLHALKVIYMTEGVYRGLFKGLMLTWLKAPVSMAVSFTVNDWLRHKLLKYHTNARDEWQAATAERKRAREAEEARAARAASYRKAVIRELVATGAVSVTAKTDAGSSAAAIDDTTGVAVVGGSASASDSVGSVGADDAAANAATGAESAVRNLSGSRDQTAPAPATAAGGASAIGGAIGGATNVVTVRRRRSGPAATLEDDGVAWVSASIALSEGESGAAGSGDGADIDHANLATIGEFGGGPHSQCVHSHQGGECGVCRYCRSLAAASEAATTTAAARAAALALSANTAASAGAAASQNSTSTSSSAVSDKDAAKATAETVAAAEAAAEAAAATAEIGGWNDALVDALLETHSSTGSIGAFALSAPFLAAVCDCVEAKVSAAAAAAAVAAIAAADSNVNSGQMTVTGPPPAPAPVSPEVEADAVTSCTAECVSAYQHERDANANAAACSAAAATTAAAAATATAGVGAKTAAGATAAAADKAALGAAASSASTTMPGDASGKFSLLTGLRTSTSDSGSTSSSSSRAGAGGKQCKTVTPVPHIELRSDNVRLSSEALLLAGGLAGACAKTVIAPADNIKILYQVDPNKRFTYKSALQTGKSIVASAGVRGLWRGHGATLLRVVPYAAVTFATFDRFHEAVNKALYSDPSELSDGAVVTLPDGTVQVNWTAPGPHDVVARFLAGAMAGATATALTYPLDLMRARQAASITSAPLYSSYWSGFRSIVQGEGVTALWAGLKPTLLGIVPYAGLSFSIFHSIKREIRERGNYKTDSHIPTWARLLAGGAAGLLAQSLTYPLDIIRRRNQVGTLQGVGTGRALRTIYATEGLKNGLFRGLSMNWMKGPVASAVSFTVNDRLKTWMARRQIKLEHGEKPSTLH